MISISYGKSKRSYGGGNGCSAEPRHFGTASDSLLTVWSYVICVRGGNDFTVGSAFTALTDPGVYATPIEDNQPLQLTLKSKVKDYLLGPPVEIEVKLNNAGAKDIPVIADINPRYGMVELAVRAPNGHIFRWMPMMQYCITPTITRLGPTKPALYDSVYIGFSRMAGVVFDQPGTHYVRGIYFALDGS